MTIDNKARKGLVFSRSSTGAVSVVNFDDNLNALCYCLIIFMAVCFRALSLLVICFAPMDSLPSL